MDIWDIKKNILGNKWVMHNGKKNYNIWSLNILYKLDKNNTLLNFNRN